MSGLYIKLFTDFYSHRKTARLRARIGDDAFWIPPRLWAYAAEHQIDGDFSQYTSEELAMLLGCSKHALSILQALKDCGFIDSEGFIHDWNDHNGFHSTNSRRAKTAAKARWEKKEKNQKKEVSINIERVETETSIAPSMLEACSKHAKSMDWALEHGVELPEPLRTNECLEASKLWIQYKRERRSPYKPTGLATAVKQWAKEFTSEDFPSAVQRSIANNYQGIYGNDKRNGGGRNGQPTPAEQRNKYIIGIDAVREQARLRAEEDARIAESGIVPF